MRNALLVLLGFSAFAFAQEDPKLIEGKVLEGLHVCEVDKLYNLKHGGEGRFCLLYRDPKQSGKRWYAIYGQGEKGQLESIVEGDDSTVTWRRVWRRGIAI